MTVPDIIIAVDGFSSTGKSSFAKLLARELGLLYLDSGALYRGVTYYAQQEGFIGEDNIVDDALKGALEGLDLHFGEAGRLYMGAECIEDHIRAMKVSSQVSPIAAVSYVRDFVDDKLHALACDGKVVMDGRDIGTTVFPQAQVKLFMTASEDVRAKRRYDEMLSKGLTPTIDEVKANLRQRDYIDSHRETSPLRRPVDSYELDNSNMTLREEVEWAKGLIRGIYKLYD